MGIVVIAGVGLLAALVVFRSSDDVGSSEAIDSSAVQEPVEGTGSSESTEPGSTADSSVAIDESVSEDIGVENYGDDERLDLLYEDCGAGDDRACDILFWVSGVSTGYETFGLECGGRGLPENGWCTPGIEFGLSDEVAADDPGLLAQGALCEGGDLTACDFVYQVSPVGSDIELVGFTCGGRLSEGAIPDCRTELG
ncbi:MAG: hypothetical protein ACRBK7_22085 [Acidimicrobiales bacterium]